MVYTSSSRYDLRYIVQLQRIFPIHRMFGNKWFFRKNGSDIFGCVRFGRLIGFVRFGFFRCHIRFGLQPTERLNALDSDNRKISSDFTVQQHSFPQMFGVVLQVQCISHTRTFFQFYGQTTCYIGFTFRWSDEQIARSCTLSRKLD